MTKVLLKECHRKLLRFFRSNVIGLEGEFDSSKKSNELAAIMSKKRHMNEILRAGTSSELN